MYCHRCVKHRVHVNFIMKSSPNSYCPTHKTKRVTNIQKGPKCRATLCVHTDLWCTAMPTCHVMCHDACMCTYEATYRKVSNIIGASKK